MVPVCATLSVFLLAAASFPPNVLGNDSRGLRRTRERYERDQDCSTKWNPADLLQYSQQTPAGQHESVGDLQGYGRVDAQDGRSSRPAQYRTVVQQPSGYADSDSGYGDTAPADRYVYASTPSGRVASAGDPVQSTRFSYFSPPTTESAKFAYPADPYSAGGDGVRGQSHAGTTQRNPFLQYMQVTGSNGVPQLRESGQESASQYQQSCPASLGQESYGKQASAQEASYGGQQGYQGQQPVAGYVVVRRTKGKAGKAVAPPASQVEKGYYQQAYAQRGQQATREDANEDQKYYYYTQG